MKRRWRQFAAAVGERWGRVDVLVNNAGISMIAPAENLSAAEYRRVLEVNLVAPFLLSKAFGAMMLARRSGSIVNVASVAGLVGVADRAAYNASKHGLIGLTRTLAAEWGGRGVRVNAVCPGWVKTEMDVADQAGGSYTRRGHHGAGADGAICFGGRYCEGDCVFGGPGRERIREWAGAGGGWRMDGGWELGVAAVAEAVKCRRVTL